MPYFNKQQLYDFEKKIFMAALELSGGLEHTCFDESAELLWKQWKNEISDVEYDEAYNKMFKERDKTIELYYKKYMHDKESEE